RGEDEPLEVPELGQLVDDQDALVGLVDRPRHDALVGLGPELRVPAIRIVAHVPEELRLARPRREDERLAVHGDEDLPRARLLHLATLLQGLLVEHPDHLARALVDDDLLVPELAPRGRDAVPAAELVERDLEDPAEEVPERVLRGVLLEGRLRAGALRTHPLPWGRVRPAVRPLVAETLGPADGRLLPTARV